MVDALYNAEDRSNTHFIACIRFLLNTIMLWGLDFGVVWPTFLKPCKQVKLWWIWGYSKVLFTSKNLLVYQVAMNF